MTPWDKTEIKELIEKELKENLKLEVYTTINHYCEKDTSYIALEYKGRTINEIPLSKLRAKMNKKG